MESEIINIYINKEYGIAAYIIKIKTGFSVKLKDTDADLFLDTSIIHADEAEAHVTAKKLVADTISEPVYVTL